MKLVRHSGFFSKGIIVILGTLLSGCLSESSFNRNNNLGIERYISNCQKEGNSLRVQVNDQGDDVLICHPYSMPLQPINYYCIKINMVMRIGFVENLSCYNNNSFTPLF